MVMGHFIMIYLTYLPVLRRSPPNTHTCSKLHKCTMSVRAFIAVYRHVCAALLLPHQTRDGAVV